MSSEEQEALARHIGSLEELAKLGVPGSHERIEVYKGIANLMSGVTLERKWELPPWPGPEGSPLCMLLANAQSVFRLRDSRGEMIDALKEFKRSVVDVELDLVEARLLLGVANRWLGTPFAASLNIELAVSLELSQIEEGDIVEYFAKATIPIIITKSGLAPAAEINLRLKAGDGLELKPTGPFLSPTVALVNDNALEGRVSGREVVSFLYRGEGTVQVWLEYETPPGSQSIQPSNVLEISLAPPAELAHPLSLSRFSNPYIPDLPLTSDVQWETLVVGNHHELLSELRKAPLLRDGGAQVIRGCRRTGKSTLLRRFQEEERKNVEFLVVYVDVYLWFLELGEKEREHTVNDDALFYELARAAIIEGEELLKDRMALDGDNEEFRLARENLKEVRDDLRESGQRLPATSLEKAFHDVGIALGRKVLLVIDELDWWVNKTSGGSAEGFLEVLTEIARRRRAFSVVLAHDLTSKGWDGGLDRDLRGLKPALVPRRVCFLEKTELAKLASTASDVRFSTMGIDLIWKISGGWPGLAVLLHYEAVEVARKRRLFGVDVGVVKEAIRNLLETKDYQEFLSYLLGSLLQKELEVLSLFVNLSLIQMDTSRIRCLRYQAGKGYHFETATSMESMFPEGQWLSETLNGLREKEIIEEVKGGLGIIRLRVGLFAYRALYEL